jgi:hypothetical protein
MGSQTGKIPKNIHSWECKLKKVAPQKQNAICKTRAQNAIALLNYLKRIAPQQLMLRMQVFTNNLTPQIC